MGIPTAVLNLFTSLINLNLSMILKSSPAYFNLAKRHRLLRFELRFDNKKAFLATDMNRLTDRHH